MRVIYGLLVVLVFSGPCLAGERDELVVHEWGTFTVLQDFEGAAVRGVNINEETLPQFVFRLAPGLAPDSHSLGTLFRREMRSKGIPRNYPKVVMRMETPIIYFYPPKNAKLPLELDVKVEFKNGWITEWYPNAKNVSPGFEYRGDGRRVGKLRTGTVGRVEWNGLKVGTNGRGPSTKEHVWLAPRAVRNAATVTTAKGLNEKYLFYRGVADLAAPVRVLRDGGQGKLKLVGNFGSLEKMKGGYGFAALWLADIKPDGRVAFTMLDSSKLRSEKPNGVLGTIAGKFKASDYTSENLAKLHHSMLKELIRDGLYEDEAKALLETWKLSYFKSPGKRLFFLIPQAWTDEVLPLHISRKAKVDRVMVGRVELVTDEQREILKRMSKMKQISNRSWLWSGLVETHGRKNASKIYYKLSKGEMKLNEAGLKVPADYKAYVALGRFRDALVMDELRKRPSQALKNFVDRYRLRNPAYHEAVEGEGVGR